MKRNHLIIGVLAPLFLLLSSGIGRHDVPLTQYYQKAQEPVFNCVGELYVKDHFGSTCVLIGRRYVLTTAHSVFSDSKKLVRDSVSTPLGMRPLKRAAYTYLTPAAQITLKFNSKKMYRCKQVFPHPLYDNAFASLGLYDVALLELEEEVPGIEVMGMYSGDVLHKKGIAVGFGDIGTGDDYEGKKRYRRVKMAGENMIDSATEVCLWADMDHPELAGFNRMGSDKPLPLEWIGAGGDSGSPLFIVENNTWYLAGISFSPTSFDDMYHFGMLKGTNYGIITGWTKISVVKEWVDKTVAGK